MDSLKTNRKKMLNSILSTFLTKKELKEFNSIVSTELSSSKTLSGTITAKNKKQIALDVNNGADLQFKIELIITFSQQKLKSSKYTGLLSKLGDFAKTIGEPDLAIMIYENIQSYLEKIKGISDFSVASAYYNLGELYRRKSKWALSFSYINKAKNIYKSNNDISGLSRCFNMQGTVYGEIGEFQKAKNSFETSLKLIANSNDIEQTGKTEINLGIVSDIIGDHNKAMVYYRKALLTFTKTEDHKRIAEIYHNLGMLNIGIGNLKQAIYDFDNSIHHCMKISYLPVMGISYLGKAMSYVKRDELKLAEQFTDKAIVIFNKTKDRLSLADAYKVKGIIFRDKKKYSKAEYLFNTSLRLNVEMGNRLNQAETNTELGILLKKTGKVKESNEKFESALQYFESINAKTRIKEIETLVA